MLKLSKNLEYALLALKYMSKDELEGKLTVKSLSNYLNAPFDPLSRVMQKMARANIIDSEKGVHGGYFLKEDLKKISLNDLILSLQGPLKIVKCMSPEFDCSMDSNCDIKSPVSLLSEKLVHFYSQVSLDELFTSTANSNFAIEACQ